MSFGYSGNNTSYMSGTCAWRTGITCIFYGAAFVSNSYAAVCICYATTCTCYGACICYGATCIFYCCFCNGGGARRIISAEDICTHECGGITFAAGLASTIAFGKPKNPILCVAFRM